VSVDKSSNIHNPSWLSPEYSLQNQHPEKTHCSFI